MDAPTNAACRLQAIALARLWFVVGRARSADATSRAFYFVRPADLGLPPDALPGHRIKVQLTVEPDR